MSSAEYLIKLFGKLIIWFVVIPIGIVISLLNESDREICTAKPSSIIKAGDEVPCWLANTFNMDVGRKPKG